MLICGGFTKKQGSNCNHGVGSENIHIGNVIYVCSNRGVRFCHVKMWGKEIPF